MKRNGRKKGRAKKIRKEEREKQRREEGGNWERDLKERESSRKREKS